MLSAHSTGGLTVPLWANERKHALAGMVLNSPWFDMQGPLWLRTLGSQVVKQIGARRPMQEIPRNVSGLYVRSLHKDHEGEWEFDLGWKPVQSWPVYAGWLAPSATRTTSCTGGWTSAARCSCSPPAPRSTRGR